MGNKQAKPEPAKTVPKANKPVTSTVSDSSDDEDVSPKYDDEAQIFITLKIFHELPHGSTQEHTMTVNPMNQVMQIKEDLAHIVHIPKECIQIYRHQHPRSEMPNNSTLHDLMVPNEKQLRVRDSRHVYSNPIIAH